MLKTKQTKHTTYLHLQLTFPSAQNACKSLFLTYSTQTEDACETLLHPVRRIRCTQSSFLTSSIFSDGTAGSPMLSQTADSVLPLPAPFSLGFHRVQFLGQSSSHCTPSPSLTWSVVLIVIMTNTQMTPTVSKGAHPDQFLFLPSDTLASVNVYQQHPSEKNEQQKWTINCSEVMCTSCKCRHILCLLHKSTDLNCDITGILNFLRGL